MIEKAYTKFTEILFRIYDEKGLDFNDFEEASQNEAILEMQKEYPEVTIEDIDAYQEKHNWM